MNFLIIHFHSASIIPSSSSEKAPF
uniref:Uncharacterized protein n=1 Tax=Rhizophora mucronata TaxID=61149 RepID=A0A2P2NB22_RHIMU